MVAKKYNWDLIRAAFVQGLKDDEGNKVQTSLKDIAEHFNVNYYQVRRKSSQENWTALRKKHYKMLAKKRSEKQAELQAYNGAVLDGKVIKAAMRGIDTVRGYFKNQKEEAMKAMREGKPLPLLKTSELVKLSSALLNFQKAYKMAVGEDIEKPNESKFVLELRQKESILTQDEQNQFKEIAMRLSREMNETKDDR